MGRKRNRVGAPRRIKLWVVLPLVFLGIPVLGLITLYMYFIGLPAKAFDSEYAAAKNAGVPMTPAEVDALRMPGKSFDELAFEKMHLELQNSKPKLDYQRAVKEGDLTVAEPVIAYSREFLATSEKIIDAGPRVDRDWVQGPNLMLRDLAPLRQACKLLGYRAHYLASKGQTELALADLKRIRKVIEHSDSEPMPITQIVGTSLRTTLMNSVNQCALKRPNDAEFLTQLEAVFPAPKSNEQFKHALYGEIFMGITLFRNLDKYGGAIKLYQSLNGQEGMALSEPPRDLRTDGPPPNAEGKVLLGKFLAVYRPALKALGEGATENDVGKLLDEQAAAIMTSKDPTNQLVSAILPVFRGFAGGSKQDETLQKLVSVFCDATRYRSKHGNWPSELKDLGQQPNDPFSEKPFKLINEGGQFKIYSVGMNGKDDLGQRKGSKDDPWIGEPAHKI